METLGSASPTLKLLRYINVLIKLVLTLMITLYGYNILINGGALNKTEIILMLLKGVIVIVFSTNTWWYTQLFRFTYSFSNTFSMLTAKVGFDETKDLYGNYIKYDGCYFGDLTSILGKNAGDNIPSIGSNNYESYPANRKYIAFFDTLDCKISKYLGMSSGKSFGNIIFMLAMSFVWPFNLGLALAIGTLMMFLFVLNFAIKAAYIFIASSMAMTVMLFVSPLIIPCILFKKTKGIFDGWLKNLISFALQPMVMFAYIGMALMIMDEYTLGEGIWFGNGRSKTLICGYSCVDPESGFIIDYTAESNPVNKGGKKDFVNACGEGKVIDLKHNSVLCYMENLTHEWWSSLLSFGVFLPSIIDLFMSDVIMFLRVGLLFFILNQGIKGIPAIAASLTGGTPLPGVSASDPFSIAKKIFDGFKTAKRVVKGIGSLFRKKKDDKDKKDDKTKRASGRSFDNKGGNGQNSVNSAGVKNDNKEDGKEDGNGQNSVNSAGLKDANGQNSVNSVGLKDGNGQNSVNSVGVKK